MPGWLPLFAPAVVQGTPNTPVVVLTSPKSVASPEFSLYGEWLAGDEFQFERQIAGGDWTAATIVNHTVLPGEISGTLINFALSALPEGDYEFRFEHKHSGGAYSNYSPVETGTISFALDPNYVTQVSWVGSGGTSVVTADAVSVGSPYTNRRIYIFGIFTDVAGANSISGATFNGVAATVYQSGVGGDLRWAATALIETGSTIDVALTFTGGAFSFGFASLYTIDETLLSSIAPHDVQHQHVASAMSGVLNVATLNGGACIFMGMLFGGASSSLSITSSDDPFVANATGFAYLNASAINAQTRTAAINVGWDSVADAYLTAWSLR